MVGEAGPDRKPSMRWFQATHANRSASFRASAAAPPNAEPNSRKCFREIGAHQGKNAPAWRRSASRYGLGWLSRGTQGARCGRGCVAKRPHLAHPTRKTHPSRYRAAAIAVRGKPYQRLRAAIPLRITSSRTTKVKTTGGPSGIT